MQSPRKLPNSSDNPCTSFYIAGKPTSNTYFVFGCVNTCMQVNVTSSEGMNNMGGGAVLPCAGIVEMVGSFTQDMLHITSLSALFSMVLLTHEVCEATCRIKIFVNVAAST